ncbi:unnamed protein product [Nesidiocoris tenuis]|uniref:Uncharacterized protein n=1 Tax=Nesidiocoris tenuis TaxID=355587 RepID=A0A6H5GTS5_9HEMI|nr:unnamed protein product [Nesidiocoris tenuis]
MECGRSLCRMKGFSLFPRKANASAKLTSVVDVGNLNVAVGEQLQNEWLFTSISILSLYQKNEPLPRMWYLSFTRIVPELNSPNVDTSIIGEAVLLALKFSFSRNYSNPVATNCSRGGGVRTANLSHQPLSAEPDCRCQSVSYCWSRIRQRSYQQRSKRHKVKRRKLLEPGRPAAVIQKFFNRECKNQIGDAGRIYHIHIQKGSLFEQLCAVYCVRLWAMLSQSIYRTLWFIFLNERTFATRVQNQNMQ